MSATQAVRVRRIKWTFRPWAGLWTVGLCVAAWTAYGIGAGVLVALATIDLKFDK